MGNLLLKLALGIIAKLLTEKLLSKLVVYLLYSLAKSTENKLDDKIVKAVADALGITDYQEI